MNDLTVIIAVYNTAKYLQECLDSVFNQSYKDFDILLVDDCSTDGSAEICEKYKNIYTKRNVEVLHNDVNMGVSGTWEKAVCHVKSKWVFVVDSDDLIHPQLLKTLLDFIKSPLGETIDILEVGQILLNDSEIKGYSWKSLDFPRFMIKCGNMSIKEKADINNGLGFSKNLIRRELCLAVDYVKYKERWPRRYFNDGLYTVLLYQKASVIGLLEDVTYIHRNRVNSTGRVLDRLDHLKDWLETDEEMYRLLRKSGEREMSIQVLPGILNSINKLIYYIDTNKGEEKELRQNLVRQFKKYYQLIRKEKAFYNTETIIRKISWRIFSINSFLWVKTFGYLYFEYVRNIHIK